MMKTGTDSIGAIVAGSWTMTCAARITRLPVMCAVKSPSSPRKLMTSVHPAMKLSKTSSASTERESIDGALDLAGGIPSESGIVSNRRAIVASKDSVSG